MKEAVKMLDSFNMDSQMIATSIDVILIHRFCILNHEVCIEYWPIAKMLTKLLDNWRAKCQIWNKISVHDIQMKPIKTSFNGFITCRTKGCKIGG